MPTAWPLSVPPSPPTPPPMSKRSIAERYDDVLARLRGPHKIGRPCPRKPWMLVTTLDADKGVCGACGGEVLTTHHAEAK